MKKIMAMVAALMMVLSCGWGSAKKKENTVINAVELGEALVQELHPRGEMMQLSERVLPNFYEIDLNDVESFYVSASSMFLAEETAVFTMKSDAAAKKVQAALENRIAELKDSFQDYRDEEYALVNENAKILSSGRTFCLLCGEKSGVEAAEALFTQKTK